MRRLGPAVCDRSVGVVHEAVLALDAVLLPPRPQEPLDDLALNDRVEVAAECQLQRVTVATVPGKACCRKLLQLVRLSGSLNRT